MFEKFIEEESKCKEKRAKGKVPSRERKQMSRYNKRSQKLKLEDSKWKGKFQARFISLSVNKAL